MKRAFLVSVMAGVITSDATAATIVTGVDLGGGVTQYELDLGGNGNTFGSGDWSAVPLKDSAGNFAGELSNTINPEAISLGSGGAQLTFTGTFGFWLGANSATQPVVKSAWYYGSVQNNNIAPTFNISGLNDGDKVSLWGMFGWDGIGRTAIINFNGLGNVSLGTSNAAAGVDPTTADMVLVASDVVVSGTSIGGTLVFPPAGEGQLGALIIQVESIPEPASIASLALVSCGLLRRRRA